MMKTDTIPSTLQRQSKCMFLCGDFLSFTPKGTNRWAYLYDIQTKRIYGGFHSSTNIGLFYCALKTRNVTQKQSGMNS